MLSLGAKHAEYQLDQAAVIGRLVILLVPFFVVLGGGYATGFNLGVLVFVTLIFGLSLWMLADLLRTLWHNPRLTIYEQGLLYTARESSKTWRWEELTHYQGRYPYGFDMPYIGIYTLEFFVGGAKAFTLSPMFTAWEDAQQRLTHTLMNQQWAHAFADFQAGTMLDFGDIQLSQAGLQLPRRLIPLADIRAVGTDQLFLRLNGGRIPLSLSSSPINVLISTATRKNALLLYNLLLYVAQQNAAQRAEK